MSDLQRVITASKTYETLLGERFSATGKGLNEKTDSVLGQLSPDAVARLRRIAACRNQIVHEAGVEHIRNPEAFDEACTFLDKYFANLPPQNQHAVPPLGEAAYSRYASYQGFFSDQVRDLLPVKSWSDLLPRWERAAQLRFVDNDACKRDLELWIRFLGNQNICSALEAKLPGLDFISTVGPDSMQFEFHRHVTPPSERCNAVSSTLKALVGKHELLVASPRIGIDSEKREAVLVRHLGLQLRPALFGRYKLARIQHQTLISIAFN